MRVVYDPTTKEVVDIKTVSVIGHVVRRARVAAGTAGVKHDRGTLAAGTRKHFWTAVPLVGNTYRPPWWKPGDGGSIGTRFATAEDATAALAAYVSEFQARDPQDWRKERKARWGF